MYILNTSFMVEHSVHDRWIAMVKDHLIPFMREKGFDSYVFTRVVSDENDGGFTYSLQVNVSDIGRYREFMKEVIGEYAAVSFPVFGEKALYFSSLLRRVEL